MILNSYADSEWLYDESEFRYDVESEEEEDDDDIDKEEVVVEAVNKDQWKKRKIE